MEKDTKKRTAVWLRPSILKRIDSNLEKDNSSTRSEYIENAVKFYSGYLESDTASDYLCDVLSTTIKGILGNQNDRLRSLLFKWAVELNMACHVISAHFGADEISRQQLRAFAEEEVKRSTGQISFDHALDVQQE